MRDGGSCAGLLRGLLKHLKTERVAEKRFRGSSVDLGWGRVYGGQTMAQAMDAAARTVEDKVIHSLACYFPRPGDVKLPIDYDVTAVGDGRSLSLRNVTGLQNGRVIFTMTVSFTHDDPTSPYFHEAPALDRPKINPDEVPSLHAKMAEVSKTFQPALRRTYSDAHTPFDYRPGHWKSPLYTPHRDECQPQSTTFIKLKDGCSLDSDDHLKVIAYLSDWDLLPTALRPHPIAQWSPALQLATVSHTLVFHRPHDLRLDSNAFLCFQKHGTSSGSGRGFVIGEILDSQGSLLATATQEGVLRPRPAHPTKK